MTDICKKIHAIFILQRKRKDWHKEFSPAYHNGIRKIQYIENYADLDSRLLTSLVSTRIRPCACAGASTLRHAYVAPCMHHVSLCGGEGEGEEGEKERQDTD